MGFEIYINRTRYFKEFL